MSNVVPFPARAAAPDEEVVMLVRLDAVTAARLMTVANECHASDPAVVLASIVHDVLADDDEAHLAGAIAEAKLLN